MADYLTVKIQFIMNLLHPILIRQLQEVAVAFGTGYIGFWQ